MCGKWPAEKEGYGFPEDCGVFPVNGGQSVVAWLSLIYPNLFSLLWLEVSVYINYVR